MHGKEEIELVFEGTQLKFRALAGRELGFLFGRALELFLAPYCLALLTTFLTLQRLACCLWAHVRMAES